MTTSPDLGVPYVPSPPPAQAEVLHNEALNMLIALQKGAIDRGLNTPPGSPADGDVYILGAAPTGVWSGKANKIAVRTSTAWTFVPGNDSDGANIAIGARHEGLKIWVQDEDLLYVWTGSAWAAVKPAYAAGDISNTPAGNIAATDVQAAINELDGEKVAKAGDTMTGFLGIGASPSYPIDVQGASSTTSRINILRTGSSGVGVQLFSTGVSGGVTTDGAGPFQLYVNHTLRVQVDTSGDFQMGGANTVIDVNRLHRMRSYTVATLPTPGTGGRHAYASNCRVFNGTGTQEGAGAGTGGLVTDNGTAWKIAGTNVTAVA